MRGQILDPVLAALWYDPHKATTALNLYDLTRLYALVEQSKHVLAKFRCAHFPGRFHTIIP